MPSGMSPVFSIYNSKYMCRYRYKYTRDLCVATYLHMNVQS